MIVYEFLQPQAKRYRFGVVLNGDFYLISECQSGIFEKIGNSKEVINGHLDQEIYIPRTWRATPESVRQEVVKLEELIKL